MEEDLEPGLAGMNAAKELEQCAAERPALGLILGEPPRRGKGVRVPAEIHVGLDGERQECLGCFRAAILGQRVNILADGRHIRGRHTVRWDGRDHYGKVVSSGIYIYKLTGDSFAESRKMVLIK